MRPAFDQWLAKPTTLCFLRRLLATHARAKSSGHDQRRYENIFSRGARSVQKRAIGYAARDGIERCAEEDTSQNGSWREQRGKVRRVRATLAPNDGLLMSLGAGVEFLQNSTGPHESFEALTYQANVAANDGDQSRLVDLPENAENMKLWIEILRFRQRLDGLKGVRHVWQGMRARNIDLPTSGEDADVLWTTFLQASLTTVERATGSKQSLLEDVFHYARKLKDRTGQHYEDIYKCVIGRLFRMDSFSADERLRQWDTQLRHAGFLPHNAAVCVLEDAFRSPRGRRALQTWKRLYILSRQRGLYDSCIPKALTLLPEGEALWLHQALLREGDGPSPELFPTPGIQRLFELDNDRSLPMRKSLSTRQDHISEQDKNALKALYAPLTRESMNTIVGDVHGIKAKEISDHFCARLFATRAFSISLVLNGLAVFGVRKLGPLALKEMAIRAGSLENFKSESKNLNDMGITIGNDLFSRMIMKVANDAQLTLWDALLGSDQDPEVYGDVPTQEALLLSSLHGQKWLVAHLALLALSLRGASASMRAWNLLLHHYIEHREYKPTLNTFQSMQGQKIPLDQHAIDLVYQHLLPPRLPGQRYVKGSVLETPDPLTFVTKVLMYASEQGANVHPGKWKELLKRYGMEHRWADVERLIFWLIEHYSLSQSARIMGLEGRHFVDRKRLDRRMNTLKYILSPQMQAALFTWGFRSTSVRRGLKPTEITAELEELPQNPSALPPLEPKHEAWAQGLALLRRLHEDGHPIYIGQIRRAFSVRMWILFGPAYSKLGVNNEARRENRLGFAHYLRHANEVWDGLIHWVDPSLFSKGNANGKKLLVDFFGPYKRVSQRRGEFVDVRAWIRNLPNTSHIAEKRSIVAKKRIWESSGLLVGWLPRAARPATLRQKHRATSLNSHPAHRSPAARLENSRPPPNPQYTPALP